MSKEKIEEQIEELKSKREEDQKGFDFVERFLIKMEDDINLANENDAKRLASGTITDPEILQIYEERRSLRNGYLEKKEKGINDLLQLREKRMRAYEENIKALHDELEKEE